MSKPVSVPEPRRTSGPATQPALHWPWQKRRDWFRDHLRQHPPAGIAPDELEAHFCGMPPHYWRQVQEADLLWGLAAVHGFLKLVTAASVPATTPYMESRQARAAAQTRVVLCTWDRLGL